jgi:hypothetical protein
MRSCKFRGHDVYLVFGQRGAAWQHVQPIYVENEAGHSLPALEEEVFEIREFPDKTQRLVGFHREYFPGQFENPTVYEWTGKSFEVSNHSNRQLYDWMHQKPTKFEDEFDPDVAELVDAANWAEAGNKKLALETLSRIKVALCEGHYAFPMQRCAELMDKLGAKKDALAVALLGNS